MKNNDKFNRAMSYLKNESFRILIFVTLFLLIPLVNLVSASEFEIHVNKAANLLNVIQDNKIIKQYSISIGRGGIGDKKKVGDKRTPVGIYYVTKLKDSDKFHYFFGLNYPNLKDGFFGYKRGLITIEQFNAIKRASLNKNTPPQNTKLGGAIGIHGIGKQTKQKLLIHKNINWTEGCIAVENHEVMELRKFIKVGTLVKITE